MARTHRLLLALATIHAISASDADGPQVDAPVGSIRGQSQTSVGVEVEEFLGIPYGVASRFSFAVPHGPIGQFNATRFSTRCPQSSLGLFLNTDPTSEDCLSLNVYRKAGTRQSNNKAVIAFIHGGGFGRGSASDLFYSAAPLAGLGDVVIVSFNYRIGVLGFADMKNLAPGNLGLHDQRLALEWIQDNIRAFGGNPDKVTLMGTSAGSMSVSAQISTPLNRKGRKLFHAAILDSGVLGAGIVVGGDMSLSRMANIAEKLGCKTEGAEMLECLRKADADELVQLSFDPEGHSPLFTLQPTVDGTFLTRNIAEDVRDNAEEFVDVKMLIGYAKDEGTFFAPYTLGAKKFPNLTTENEFVEWCGKLAFGYKYPMNFSDNEIRKSVSETYYQKSSSRFMDASAFVGDGTFVCPVNAFVRGYSKAHNNVYVYRFDRKLRQAYPNLDSRIMGAFHASAYAHMTGVLFPMTTAMPSVTIGAEDKAYTLDAMQLVVNFVKTDKAPSFRGVPWPDFSKGEGVMVLDDKPHVSPTLYAEDRCSTVFPFFASPAK